MIADAFSGTTSGVPLNWLNRCAKHFVDRTLRNLQEGQIILRDSEGERAYGSPADLACRIQVHHGKFYREVLLGGKLSVAESYLNGHWDCDDLTALIRIFIRNLKTAHGLESVFAWLSQVKHRWIHWMRDNTRSGSRKNIGEHYDLGNDFFRVWLDDTLAYSSGIFGSPHTTLRDASIEKFDRICRKLNLQPNDKLIEIGSGWGGFALHAAKNFGAHVTTTTISAEQFKKTRRRVRQSGLGNRIEPLQQDYRDLTGQFDKLVSIEMIEAVGKNYLGQYLAKCDHLLNESGTLVLQAIVMPEHRYLAYTRNVDFVQRYVFPGGCLPSLGRILDAAGRSTRLRLVHLEDLGAHYAETLRRWKANFQENLAKIREQGYTERLIRLWQFYLSYCEAAFEERHIGCVQIQFDKPGCRRDPLQIGRAATQPQSSPSHRHLFRNSGT